MSLDQFLVFNYSHPLPWVLIAETTVPRLSKKESVAKVDLVLRTKPQVGRRHRLTDSHTSNINVTRVGGGHRDLNSNLWQA